MALTNNSQLWEAARRFLRVATIALSVASAGVMLSANDSTGGCCEGAPAGEVSYSDFNSFTYSMAANLLSGGLQVAAAYLTWHGGKDSGGEVVKCIAELIDAVTDALISSSFGLSLSVDNFGKCGGRRISGICKCNGSFCKGVRKAGGISIAAAVALAVSQYLNDRRELEEEGAQGQ
nr:unnamed protein product [Digitaria exilis]